MKVVEAAMMAGGKGKLASVLGVTPQIISRWGEELPELRYYQLKGLIAEKKFKPVKPKKVKLKVAA